MMKEWKFRSKVLATAFLLNASMIAPGFGAYAASGDGAKAFGDVKKGAWYYDAVFYAKENCNDIFTDVPQGKWYQER